ncbi:MAG: hypothetical protein HND52_14785 [Ignavibacteriae bacterium]|nr:hypothetical protein [Ignavibacteriota bacterium]NOG99220.1 hypothetical protein [Ignavibacteriota bacterium]
MTLLQNIGKWFLKILIIVIAVEAIHFLIIANPSIFFSDQLIYKRYHVYSDESINHEVLLMLDDVEERIKMVEVFDPSFSPKIFLCNDQGLYSFFATLLGMSPNSSGINVSLVSNTFINLTRLEEKQNYNNKLFEHSHIAGEESHNLAHELVHNLTANKLGWFEYRKLPKWKNEGYAEYGVAIKNIRLENDSNSLFNRAKIYFEEYSFKMNNIQKLYLESQLIVEYLFEIENIGFEKFSDATTLKETALLKFKNWYNNYSSSQ